MNVMAFSDVKQIYQFDAIRNRWALVCLFKCFKYVTVNMTDNKRRIN